ncbi:hypothetical protein Tco_1174303 [Tanacetum coccineum]
MLEAVEVQIPQDNLDDLRSLREEDGTSEIMDPQDLLAGLDVSLSRTTGFLRGASVVVVILVKGYAFPTIVKVRPNLSFFVLPEGCDPLALVDGFTPVEDNIGLLEARFDVEAFFVIVFLEDVTGSVNLTLLTLFIGVTAHLIVSRICFDTRADAKVTEEFPIKFTILCLLLVSQEYSFSVLNLIHFTSNVFSYSTVCSQPVPFDRRHFGLQQVHQPIVG